jgi:Fic family protein
MHTLHLFAAGVSSVPQMTAWYLSDLGEARGKQELFTRQAPQRLKALREHAMVESAVSSNRMEGVTVEPSRVATLVFGKPLLRDRDEEEVRGYRDALSLIHDGASKLDLNEKTVQRLHRMCRGGLGDAGAYKEKDNDIIEKYADGRERVRCRTVPAAKAPAATRESLDLWREGCKDRTIHPLILMAGFNLDFLCVHPFRDGNGRVSRLLLLLQAYGLGYEVGRYISLERLIEQNKERYYETLEQSSQGWHGGKHDPWPYINYVLYTLKTAYQEFERRVGQTAEPKGAKTEVVVVAIGRLADPFRVSDLQRECPGVSLDMIRLVLKKLRGEKRVECLGRGQAAAWRKAGLWTAGVSPATAE